MAHIFSFNGGTVGDGWTVTNQYGSKQIAAIKDPSGASASIPITSIPTPFASFELVKDAFKQVTDIAVSGQQDKNGNIINTVDGSTIYHKLVSEALDVLEIFFNFDKFKNQLEIIEWNAVRDLGALTHSTNQAHKRLGESLRLFMSQGKANFNFDKLSNIYMLRYKGGSKPITIVGGTSPTSVCAASPNDNSFVNVFLSNNHKAFDPKHFQPLTKRSASFIMYVWSLTLESYTDADGNNVSFSSIFPQFYNYVQQCYAEFGVAIVNQISTIKAGQYLSDYKPVNSTTTYYLIGQIPLLQQGATVFKSDFQINTNKFKGQVPLALPMLPYATTGMWYVNGPWNPLYKTPLADPLPMNQRTLPNDGTVYPYLTADDLFDPYLIKTAFPINRNKFLTGYKNNTNDSYLIPLKEEVFKYFDTDFLFGFDNNNQPIFELTDISFAVKATLRIPVQKGQYITYERIYFKNGQKPNITKNQGQVIESNFDLYVYPFFHYIPSPKGPQRVYLIDSDTSPVTRRYDYRLSLIKNNNQHLQVREVVRVNKNINNNAETTKCYSTSDEYDFIEVDNGIAKGLVIPRWNRLNSQGRQFKFAIDFGTTNTHIEYRETGSKITEPIEYNQNDNVVESLHDSNDQTVASTIRSLGLNKFINYPEQEFLPLAIGSGRNANLPTRTNLCIPKTINISSGVFMPLADTSIGFHYEKQPTASHNNIMTNLKWDGGGNSKLVESYLAELLYIIRAKTIVNGGDLDKLEIIWFYPISMLRYQRDQLASTWRKLCNAILSPKVNLIQFTESVAPYFYYKNQEGVSSLTRPVVSMDIGGGTSDVVIYEKNKPVVISSSRFAGNDLYGDFYGRNMQMNGFVNKYGSEALAQIVQSGITSLKDLYTRIKGRGVSSDLITFLYSLKSNKALNNAGMTYGMEDKLAQDSEMKIVILLFLAAEIYHIASIFKAKNIPSPSYLTLSGTASKVFKIFSDGALSDFTSIIFRDVVGNGEKITIKTVDKPKEITCKGGLNTTAQDLNMDVDKILFNVNGSRSFDAGDKTFTSITEEVKEEVLETYRHFVNYFFSIDRKFSFMDNFGIDNSHLGNYRGILLDKADEDLSTVIEEREKEAKKPDAETTDSMFFYPIAGGLNKLAYFISKNTTK